MQINSCHSQSKKTAQGRFHILYWDSVLSRLAPTPRSLPAIVAATVVVLWSLLPGFINFNLAAVEAGTIEFLNSLLRFSVARHIDEGKALALTHGHVDRIDRPVLAIRSGPRILDSAISDFPRFTQPS